MNFYASIPEGDQMLQQGDLLADVPFTYFPLTNVMARSKGETRSRKRTSHWITQASNY